MRLRLDAHESNLTCGPAPDVISPEYTYVHIYLVDSRAADEKLVPVFV
jgi:hypothetical protein